MLQVLTLDLEIKECGKIDEAGGAGRLRSICAVDLMPVRSCKMEAYFGHIRFQRGSRRRHFCKVHGHDRMNVTAKD
jgi:hypothetical protein